MELLVTKEVFYNEDSMFGIYGCKPVHYTTEIQLNKYNNFSLQGETRRLKEGDTYVIKFDGTYPNKNPRFDDFYKIIEVQEKALDTVYDQDNFLSAILADNHMKSLKSAYPNVLLMDYILEDKIDVSKTKGIKKKTLAKIKETVQNNAGLSILISKLNELSLTTTRIERILKHFGSADKAVYAIEDDIYNLCDIPHFGFSSIDKIAISNRGDNPTNSKRIYACINHLLKEDGREGSTWSAKKDVFNKAVELLNISEDIVQEVFNQLENKKKYYVDEERIALSKVRDKELSVYRHLERIEKSYIPPVIDDIEERVLYAEGKQGFNFTEEQRDTIVSILNSNSGVAVINGVAGSGKSFIVKSIVNILQEDSYMSACLSGKAANILMKNGIRSSTIHRMLKWKPKDNEFEYGKKKKLPCKLLILDEMSMNNISLTLSVLEAIDDNTLLLLVGDSGQLPSIGSFSGNILRDLLETKRFPSYELKQVFRQGASSGILEVASIVRDGNQLMPYNSSGKEVYGENGDQTLFSYSDKLQIESDIIRICRSYKANIKKPEDLLDFQVIVANRERGGLSVRNLNNRLQEIFNNMDKPSLDRNGYGYRQGDKIISQGNSYGVYAFDDEFEYLDYLDSNGDEKIEESLREVDIYNGTLGYIYDVNIKEKTVLVQFEDIDGLIAIPQQSMEIIDLAYASTCHKMQGSGIKHIICGLSFDAYKLLSRQMLYTMVTRGSEKSVLLVENNAMYTAINNDASTIRNTFLAEFMLQDMNNI